MRNRFMDLLATFAMVPAFSAITFAQTYGTKGYSPGAWKPEELPKDLSKPKPYDPHDFVGVWSSPTKAGYFERHALNDKWLDIKDKSIPDKMRTQTYSSPMTAWAKPKLQASK